MLALLLDLVLPRRCAGCRCPGALLCRRCLPGGPLLISTSGDGVTAAATAYAGAVRTALLQYKERGRRELARPLGDLLAAAVGGLGGAGPGCVLVPVPSGRAVAARRGGDHVLRLARRAAAAAGRPVVPALSPARVVADSAGLDTAARAANLHGAFRARAPGSGSGFAIVVDDITTTGATLREARRALVAAGWTVPGSAVVAATQRRYPVPTRRRCA